MAKYRAKKGKKATIRGTFHAGLRGGAAGYGKAKLKQNKRNRTYTPYRWGYRRR